MWLAGGYAAQFSATAAGKATGNVLVLDVSSLWKKHPTQPQISTQDAGECQRRCSKLPGEASLAAASGPLGARVSCAACTLQVQHCCARARSLHNIA